MTKRILLHPFLFAIFPILALLAYNLTEINFRVALRPIAISVAVAFVLFLLISLISRNWQKAAIATTYCVLLFFTYGHIYEIFQKYQILGFSLGRHRYLVVIYGLLLLIGFYWIFRKLKDTATLTQALNLMGILLLIYPIFRITNYAIHTNFIEQKISETSITSIPLNPENPKKLPDIYIIVLDSYTRADALLRDYGFDNSPFLNSLRSMGFYVADCSRSNYPKTNGSLAALLNMDYLPNLNANLATQGFNPDDSWVLIKHSQVRNMLESIGYKTVAFDSGFDWSRLSDADVFLKYSGEPFEMQVFQPFEVMLLRTTALLIWSDSIYKSLPGHTNTTFNNPNFNFEDHINRQLYILDQLPRLASFPGPKLVFAHLIIPHYPFVFKPNGEIVTDPRFFDHLSVQPSEASLRIEGYTNEIQFVNSRMIEILNNLVTKSNTPPIIILMGDHGLENENRELNLSAYYLPENGVQSLYSSITPVNSFRVIFDTYFGTNFGLLEDRSYVEEGDIISETSPECLP
jgi:hypothetical protein